MKNNDLAKRLKQLRQDRKLTQEEIGEKIGIKRTTYGEYERGKLLPPSDKLSILATYYGVSVDYLLGKTNLTTPQEGENDDLTDVSVVLRRMIDELENDRQAVIFEGERLSDETRALLVSSLKNSIQMTKLTNRK